ncbi:LLM class flavin-dependent oxidoreductase [Flaviaesturariibacter flavus]|uniref:Luciferase-like monooxygenase n=1 Tax=Flaviaesturariibacter flavus TaxID=2502780 RepID=A0A4R1BBT3_9BACT|nr:LLM class flavin-dependent oxidoreductase [Flaviaesturariibacter flavus]TCJ14444.1 LLM class flavin-dependent oxidoreductase [Flaviaesturariibacter flavus]
MKNAFNIPLSVLDLATVVEGEGVAGAFRRAVAGAQGAERLGCTRYWFAEHHNMESVASAATSVLIGHVAGHTERIRVGAGGIMLPNHAPLVIAEQFGTLEALYPGRIDLGLGRAPGTDPLTAGALRRSLSGGDDFPNDVVELLRYLGPQEPEARVRAIPGEGSHVPVWLLGSSTYSAQLAAMLGLPFAFASHFAPTYLHEALALYKARFTPSQYLREPYAMACVGLIAADTDGEAERLATSFYQLVLGLIRNKRRPLQPPTDSLEGLMTPAEEAAVAQFTRYAFVGSPSTVQQELGDFIAETGIQELMVTSHIYGLEERSHSLELVAPLFQPAS